MCAVVIFSEEKEMLIGGIEVGRYGKLSSDALAIALDLNGSIPSVTRKVEKIIGNDETLTVTVTLALTEEKA